MYSRRILKRALGLNVPEKIKHKKLRIPGIILTSQNSIRLKKKQYFLPSLKMYYLTMILFGSNICIFVSKLQCAHLFSPEPAKKGVSIADYLPSVRTERKNSESEHSRMPQETQKLSIETPSVQTETRAVKETSTATTESHRRQSSVRQRKFSFKKGKVRYEGVQHLKVQSQEIE